jgi:bifunctional enzyme CysN/CysC
MDVVGVSEEPHKDLLRFLTCGSVDDGKSTLIGRLLHDSKLVLEDQLSALARDSLRYRTTADQLDFALLMDGLEAEREQGITIDVAYRSFATARRSFIVADAPGHEQYTRNMATGASNADLAVVLIDARKGMSAQTRRHSMVCALLGLRHIVLAVNKIDLVSYRPDSFYGIFSEFKAFASSLGFYSIAAIPVSARHGDNIVRLSNNMPWYSGPALLDYLETVDASVRTVEMPFRFPVQWVNRANLDFRGYAGTVVSGAIQKGDAIVVASSDRVSRIKELLTYDGPLECAEEGDAVTITLVDELDIARGDLLVSPSSKSEVSDQFAAHIIWMCDQALIPGRSYLARIGTRNVPIAITQIRYKIDVNTGEHLAVQTLGLNDIGFCNLTTGSPVAFDPYEQNRKTGAFIIIDRWSNHTVGAGMICFGLGRGTNIHPQPTLIEKVQRAAQKHQKPAIIWFTGLSGAGKSTIANIVEQQLHLSGYHTMLLDGDNIRHGLNRDLGFTEAGRVENIRRAGQVAKLMVDAGLLVLCSFISPYAAEREIVRQLVQDGEFIEVFVDTPLEECERRDPKGLYAKARAGKIKNFTGLDAPYEAPINPEIHLHTNGQPPEFLASRTVRWLAELGIIRR